MNIIITKEEHEFLLQHQISKINFGSKLYGISDKYSDKDYLCEYSLDFLDERTKNLLNVYFTQHQFQYKDIDKNIDYIWTNSIQFWKNLNSGDSTINADILLFTDEVETSNIPKIDILYTYKIIKGYLGFAKRDLKQIKEGYHKLIHAERGLWIAKHLIDKEIPIKENLKKYLNKIKKEKDLYLSDSKIFNNRVELLKTLESELRKKLNDLYEKNLIKNYFIRECDNPIINKLLHSINIKEFKY